MVLDVYKARKHNTVLIKGTEYKIPNEYTVEETERLLELAEKRSQAEDEEVDKKNVRKQLKAFWQLVFDQLEVIFQHYQPELTADELRGLLTHNEALEILGFYDKYRFVRKEKPGEESEDSKKKKPSRELKEIRRMVAFMVANGFSLLDVRKLYIDELFAYYEELIFVLEKSGKVKEGSYDKIHNSVAGADGENQVNLLRKQLFKSLADAKKPKR